jgi:hypothetical protein
MAINDELPILEYLVATGWEDDATLIFTGTIQAPHLGLVTLCLYMDDSSTYLKSKLPAPVDFIPASTRDARDHHHLSQPCCGDAAVVYANYHTFHTS